jgi:hypothetical protein
MTGKGLALLAAIVLLGAGCAPAAQPPLQGGGPTDSVRVAPPPAGVEPKPAQTGGEAGIDVTQRKIVRNGDLAIEVGDPLALEPQVRRIAEEAGGYVVSSRTYRVQDGNAAELTVRVPAQKFSEVFDRIKALSDRIPKNAQITTQDVTEEYIDLRARLQALEAVHDRLVQLLKEARTVEDALKVEQALRDNEAEIERVKGRLQFLERSSDFSSIHVQLLPVPPQEIGLQPGAWNPLATLLTALNSYIRFLQAVADAAIYVVIFAGPPALLLWLIVRTLLRRRRPRPAGPQAS